MELLDESARDLEIRELYGLAEMPDVRVQYPFWPSEKLVHAIGRRRS